MNRLVFSIVAIVAVGVGLLIGTLNAQQVSLDLLWFRLDWPLGLLILMFFSAGLLLGFALLYLSRVIPLQMRMRKLSAAHKQAESKALTTKND